jgi:hypothetical protein
VSTTTTASVTPIHGTPEYAGADDRLLREAVSSLARQLAEVQSLQHKILDEQIKAAERDEKILRLLEAQGRHLDTLTSWVFQQRAKGES